MPELPEVETMVRGLRPALAGRTIEQARSTIPFLLQGCDAPRSSSGAGEGARSPRWGAGASGS